MTPLAIRMHAYASEHPGNERMRELADEMNKAVADCGSDKESIKRMIGAVARARVHWCEVTGEQLVPDNTIKTAAQLFSALMPRRVR